MSEDLLPCPFCGKDDSLLIWHDPRTVLHPWYRVECDHCGAKGPGSDHGDHVEWWNKRAENERLRGLLVHIDAHYSGSLDHQPAYVRLVRAALADGGKTC